MDSSFRVYNAGGNYKRFYNEKSAYDDFNLKRKEALKLAKKNGDYASYGRIQVVREKDAKRFDVYERKNSNGKYDVTIRDNQKLKNNDFDYTASLYDVSQTALDKYKKKHGITSSNSERFLF